MRMRFAGREWKIGRNAFMPVFCVGLLAGIIILNMGKGILLEGTGLFDEDTLYRMKYMTVDSNALFCYILRKRVVRLAVLVLLSTTYLGLAVRLGVTFWYGMSAGAFLAALTLRYGIKGIALALAGIFPQYLIYIPAALFLLSWCETLFRGIYARGGGGISLEDRGLLIKKAGQLAGALLAVTVGCLLEGYVNPYLFLGFLKIF